MKKYALRKKPDEPAELAGIDTALQDLTIRIYGEGYPETEGKLYFEGSLKTFVVERIPSQAILDLLPALLTEQKVSYRLSQETLYIERI